MNGRLDRISTCVSATLLVVVIAFVVGGSSEIGFETAVLVAGVNRAVHESPNE
jgi:hypothetical protein